VPNSQSTPRVLVVDDHHDGAESLGNFLEVLGCEVRLAHSGEEALRVAPTFQPQLVILDIEMPGMDGYETARRLRTQRWARSSVFASHSGSADPAIADLSKQAGCDEHIAKPAEAETFERILQLVRDRCAQD
jgi:CheY-like chemotaxis protein